MIENIVKLFILMYLNFLINEQLINEILILLMIQKIIFYI